MPFKLTQKCHLLYATTNFILSLVISKEMFCCYFYACSLLLLTQKSLKIKINEKNSQKVKTSSKNKPIVYLDKNGTMPKDIAKMLNKPLSTVYTVIKHFQMTGRVKRKLGSGLRRSVLTPQLIKAVKG